MPASITAPAPDNRFQSLSPCALSKSEKSSVVALALKVLSQRFRRGRVLNSPQDIEGFLRLKLTGRRNEVFGIIYLDTRHRLIEIAELFKGTVDGATVYPRVVVQQALEKNAAAIVIFHNHPERCGRRIKSRPRHHRETRARPCPGRRAPARSPGCHRRRRGLVRRTRAHMTQRIGSYLPVFDTDSSGTDANFVLRLRRSAASSPSRL